MQMHTSDGEDCNSTLTSYVTLFVNVYRLSRSCSVTSLTKNLGRFYSELAASDNIIIASYYCEFLLQVKEGTINSH